MVVQRNQVAVEVNHGDGAPAVFGFDHCFRRFDDDSRFVQGQRGGHTDQRLRRAIGWRRLGFWARTFVHEPAIKPIQRATIGADRVL